MPPLWGANLDKVTTLGGHLNLCGGHAQRNRMPQTRLKIKDLPAEERPRERLARLGPGVLSNAELLALILRTGHRGENAVALSQQLLRKFDLSELARAELDELQRLIGIKRAKAAQLVACFELGRRVAAVAQQRPIIKSTDDAVKVLGPQSHLRQEHLRVLLLNSRHALLKIETISVGSLNTLMTRPAEVFRPALTASAAAIILAHNHPSGDPMPSKEDVELAKKLAKIGRSLGIMVLDHIILGHNSYISLAEEGVL